MIALHISAVVLVLYAIASLILPLKLKFTYKACWALVIIGAGLKYMIYSRTGGILEPKLPRDIIVLLEALYSALLLVVVMALLKDLMLLLIWVGKVLGLVSKFKLQHGKVAVVIGLTALSLGVFGTLSQFKVPEVYDETVYVKNLPHDLEGYQIVQLTDLHIGPILKKDFLQGVVERTNSLNADLVVITGDLVDGSVAKLKHEFTPFKELRARHGVLAVTGNHEYYSGANPWVKTWESMGIKFLFNQSVLLQQGSASLKVAGVPDRRGVQVGAIEPNINHAYSTIVSYQKGMSTSIEAPHALSLLNQEIAGPVDITHGKVKAAKDKEDKASGASQVSFNISKPSADQRQKLRALRNAQTVVLLAHNPSIASEGDLRADLVLTGHTHGGIMFFLKPLIAHFNAGYVSGMYKLNERTHLYVSNGTGIWSGFSCRILVPSQIVRFTLQRAP